MDLFEKCQKFYSDSEYARRLGYPTSPRLARALGMYPFLVPITHTEGPEVTVDGRRLVMIGSNNYLGLTTDPRVQEAAIAATRRYGTGCTGSRFLNGTLPLHEQLEEELAAFVGKPCAAVFATGYQTNVGVISALVDRNETVIGDRNAHASVLDGMRLARGTRGAVLRHFRHNAPASLSKILRALPPGRGTLVVVDGVFSMEGDIAPLPEISLLCRRYGARLMVDDAHGFGVLGEGRGTASHWGCSEGVDLIVGTFSKSLASNGGFVAGAKDVIQWIQHFGRSFMFSASLSPASTAAALAALEVIRQEPERVRRVNEIAAGVRRELRAMGYDVGKSETPIVPILLGDEYRALQSWNALFKAGIYANVAVPPAVASPRSLLRTSYMATHTDLHIERVLDAFKAIRAKLLPRRARGAVRFGGPKDVESIGSQT